MSTLSRGGKWSSESGFSCWWHASKCRQQNLINIPHVQKPVAVFLTHLCSQHALRWLNRNRKFNAANSTASVTSHNLEPAPFATSLVRSLHMLLHYILLQSFTWLFVVFSPKVACAHCSLPQSSLACWVLMSWQHCAKRMYHRNTTLDVCHVTFRITHLAYLIILRS